MFVFLSKVIPPFVYPLGLSLILIAAALFLQRRHKLQRLSLILAIFLLWAFSNRWTAALLARSLEWRYLPPKELVKDSAAPSQPIAEVMVVLGGGTDSEQFPRPTVEVNGAGDRVIYAASLYKQGKAPNILLSGGRIDWMESGNSPAEDMAALLKLMGIPQEALWLETTSRNTAENAEKCWEILSQKGIRRIILVTSASHMPRAVGLFQQQGFEVIPAPTDYSITQADWTKLTEPNLATQFYNLLPSASYLSSVTTSLKEYLGMLVYQLRGKM